MADTTFIKFLFREDWAALKEVLSAYGNEYAQIHNITDEKELSKVMIENQPTLVLASVKSKEDIAKILGFLKANKRLIKENSIKFSAVNFTYNRQVETALMKIGCQEVLDPGVKGKALKYKLDFWKKALTGGQPKGGSDAKLSIKDKAQENSAAELKADAVKWEDGLKCVDDMWLIRSQEHAKKILGKWLVKFMGPSPFVGQWTEAAPGKKGVWRYVFKDAIRSNFHKTEGHWFFFGEQKPEFIWKENLWMVTGAQFQLMFQLGEEKAVRFMGAPGQLTVCKNSAIAKAREAAIIETFDQEVMVKKGIISDTATAVDTDNEVAGHYKGDTEGEAPIDNGPMEGKSSTDDLGGNLEGAVSEQEAGDTGPYEGKSSTDQIDDTPDGKSGGDNLGASKYKGKMKFDKDNRTTDWGGESETDDLGPSHYTNQEGGVSHEKEQKDKANKLKRDELPKGEMNGDIETEDLGPSHYSNQKKTPEQQLKDKEHKLQKDVLPKGEMNGELETEDLGPAHYSNQQKEAPAAAKEKAHALKKDELPKGEMNGDIETEDLGPAHYGSKEKRAEAAALGESTSEIDDDDINDAPAERGSAPLKGKSETDDLGSDHYGGKREKSAAAADESQEDYFRQMKEKKKRRQENYQAGVEAEEQREKEHKEQQERRKEEAAAKKSEADEDSNVVPILREKAPTRSPSKVAPNGQVEEESEVSPDYNGPAVTANAVVTVSIRKAGTNVEVLAHIDDFFDNQVIVRAPSGQFQAQQNVEISVSFDYMKKIKKADIKGICAEVNNDGEGSSYLTVEMDANDTKLFEQFMKLYELRQAHVQEFIKQAKGL